jgi:hypothetical protein
MAVHLFDARIFKAGHCCSAKAKQRHWDWGRGPEISFFLSTWLFLPL